MINITFWNANYNVYNKSDVEKGNRIDEAIIGLISENQCDILVLAEYDLDINALCDKISLIGRNFKEGPIACDTRAKLLVDSRFIVNIIRDSNYYFVCSIQTYRGFDFLLAGVHFPSKLNAKSEDQEVSGHDLMTDIKEAEKAVDHEKVIIIGDFNSSPFEGVMIKADGIHAIPYADIVEKKEKRIFYGKERQIFYNPMWNFIGDFCNSSATYYYDSGGAVNFYRNIFDQVIFSARMIKYFTRESLKILTQVGEIKLLNDSGKPDKENYSDHLPITFRMKEEENE